MLMIDRGPSHCIMPMWPADFPPPVTHRTQSLSWTSTLADQQGWDVNVNDDEVVLSRDLPGVSAEDVELTLNGNRLAVAVKTEGRRGLWSVRLPHEVDASNLTASLELGVLTVTGPRIRRTIPVTAG